MCKPVIGHLDPDFLAIMDEIVILLREVFGTRYSFTIPISDKGSASMEAAIFSLVEPGDPVLACTNGYSGARMAEIVHQCHGIVREIRSPWGTIIDADHAAYAMKGEQIKLVCIVHAETSTGALQPLEEISTVVGENGGLLLVDAVTSLGGIPVPVDKLKIDVCYSGIQKRLSCLPGLTPMTIGPRAVELV
jgi:alanine-glyoxylate transaminase/serine-glyoxylate transaminase/serine-pyruvate transaminase